MEKQLGFPVFERDNRKVLVTPAGREVLDRARSIALQMAANHDPLCAAHDIRESFGRTAMAQVPDAHGPEKRHAPIMFTTDMALKMDSGFRKISERFLKSAKEFDLAFARAWLKLTHRDLGISLYLSSQDGWI
jgi:catalase (peroxidase I)